MENALAKGTVFINNRSQAVRLPAELRLPEGVKQVSIRARGHERIIAPLSETWDSFFINPAMVTEDFMEERGPQEQQEREAF